MSSGRRRLSIYELRRPTLPIIEDREPERRPIRRRTVVIQDRVIETYTRQPQDPVLRPILVSRRPRSPSPQPTVTRVPRRRMSGSPSKDRGREEVPLPPKISRDKDGAKSGKASSKSSRERSSSRHRTAQVATSLYDPLIDDEDDDFLDLDLTNFSPRSGESSSRSPNPLDKHRSSGERSRYTSGRPLAKTTSRRGKEEERYLTFSGEAGPSKSLSRKSSLKRRDYQDAIDSREYVKPAAYKDKFQAVKENSRRLQNAFLNEKDTAEHNLRAATKADVEKAVMAAQLEAVNEKLAKAQVTNQILKDQARDEVVKRRLAEQKLKLTGSVKRNDQGQLKSEDAEREERRIRVHNKTWEEIENSPSSSPVSRRPRESFSSRSRPTSLRQDEVSAEAAQQLSTGNAGMDAILEAQADVDRRREQEEQLPGGVRRQTARSNTRYERPGRDLRYK